MANWKTHAIDDLRELPALQESVRSLPEEIMALEEDMRLVKGTAFDKAPVQGGASGYDERLINYIDLKTRLGENLQAASGRAERIERGLAVLSETERLVLERFYIHREPKYLDRLCVELGYEKSQVYRIKENAIKKFTLARCGMVDL